MSTIDTTARSAMKLALEALNNLITSSHATDPQHWRDARQDAVTALAAIDKALAQERSSDEQPAQQQEPVAWMYPDDYERMTTSETFCTVYSVEVGSATRGESTVALYTTPPQRKPLTDEQIDAIADEYLVDYRIPAGCALNFARDIEAAHGIKGDA